MKNGMLRFGGNFVSQQFVSDSKGRKSALRDATASSIKIIKSGGDRTDNMSAG